MGRLTWADLWCLRPTIAGVRVVDLDIFPEIMCGGLSPHTLAFHKCELDHQAMSHFLLSSPLRGFPSEK